MDFFAVAGGREDWRLLKEDGEMVDGLLIDEEAEALLEGRVSLSLLRRLTTFGLVLLFVVGVAGVAGGGG